MTLSQSAKHNIAFSALSSYLAEPNNSYEMALLISDRVIEQGIGSAGTDIDPELFSELRAEIFDCVLRAIVALPL